jgi:hypothetical protein
MNNLLKFLHSAQSIPLKCAIRQSISNVFTLFIALLSFNLMYAQQSTVLGVIFQGTSAEVPASNGTESQNPNLNTLLSSFDVASYAVAYSGAKTLKAQNCFKITLDNASNADYEVLAAALLSMNYEEAIILWPPMITENSISNENIDPCLEGLGGHYLVNARVREAWDITHGDPNIIIALVDQYMDYTHDDLDGKIVSIWNNVTPYNPTGGLVQGCSPANHGYGMAGAMAAIPDNDYCVAGTGYDTRVAFYAAVDDDPTPDNCKYGFYLVEAIIQAYLDGHKIMSVSWGGSGISRSMMQEMIDSGVTFVHSCAGVNSNHGVYHDIPGVIGVGQANQNLEYEQYAEFGGGWDNYVDIYAPCINVCRLESGNSCVPGEGNSSFGAAMTAGIVALIKSVNGNLCPSEIENIIEKSNRGLPVNASSWPLMTQGLIDAEAAVTLAKNYGHYTITTDTEWTTDHFVSELTIEPGAQLKITNAQITMGANAAVIVKRNARLILDNSTMENCAEAWSGIKVWGNIAKAQPGVYVSLNDPEQCGIVALKNNSTIKGAKIGISTTASGLAWPGAKGFYGGLVDCQNSNFLNCRKGVEFMQYPDPSSNFTFSNKSKFLNCRFEEVGNTANPVVNSEGVTIWDTDGIEFQRCQFYNLDNDGILISDASAQIFNANQFYNNQKGISAMATYPFSTYLQIGRKDTIPNDFNNNKTHIDGRATNKLGGLKIVNNEFFGGDKGVYLEGPTNYFVEFNRFTGPAIGLTAVNTGIMNAFQENRVTCNGYNTGIGNYFAGENRQVQVLSNTFSNSGSDIIVSDFNTQAGAIRVNQGSGAIGAAGNCFTTPIVNADIATLGNTLPFIYFFRQESTCDENPNTPGNYTKAFASKVIDCSTYLGSGFTEPPTRNDLVIIRNLVNNLEQQLSANPGTNNTQTSLLDAMSLKEATLRYLIEDALDQGDYTTAETLLNEENTVSAKHAVFGLKMNRGAFNEAKLVLRDLPSLTQDDIWFRGVQNINIARLELGDNFVLTSEQLGLLKDVAHSESGISVYAQSILTLLTGERFERNFGIQYRQQPEIKPFISKPTVRISPNPAANTLNVDLGQTAPAGSWLTILDQLGRIVLHKDVSAQQAINIDVSGLLNGIYFVQTNLLGDSQQLRVLISK